jgi:hypothetical protein
VNVSSLVIFCDLETYSVTEKKIILCTCFFIYDLVRVTGFSAWTPCEEKHNEICAAKKNEDPFSVIMSESLLRV